MRRLVVNMLALAVVLAGVSLGLGQSGPPSKKPRVEEEDAQPKAAAKKSKLEEMLAEALKSNPDIRVAAANVALAEAELNRTRLQVTQKVIALHAALASQNAEVDYRKSQYERMKSLEKSKSISSEILQEAQQKLVLAKAKLAELEAQLPALLGKTARTDEAAVATQRALIWLMEKQDHSTATALFKQALTQQAKKMQGPMAERIRKALQTPIKVDYNDMTFDAILKDLAKNVPGLSFRTTVVKGGKMSLRFDDPLPVSAILQALADEVGCLFFVREYGILVTTRNGAPDGAMTVEEFLRQSPKSAEPSPGSKPDAEGKLPKGEVEGRVTSVDAPDRVRINLGVKDGVNAGDIVEVYRLDPKPIYLGSLVIGGSLAGGAVGKPQGRLAAPIKPGDRVISRKSRPSIRFRSKEN